MNIAYLVVVCMLSVFLNEIQVSEGCSTLAKTTYSDEYNLLFTQELDQCTAADCENDDMVDCNKCVTGALYCNSTRKSPLTGSALTECKTAASLFYDDWLDAKCGHDSTCEDDECKFEVMKDYADKLGFDGAADIEDMSCKWMDAIKDGFTENNCGHD
ncbi:uncharacterized protein LOC141904551 [Tubulanus polymorphus]|uniref:uncharacterized protein LOC141904551 n=1 Tax=Tubulanus polymorphus TaxID=672921 RepID=UPI003DA2A51A